MQQGRGRPPFRPPEPPIIAGRVPPHDLDAEAAVLSAILLKRDALDQVAEILKPEHFYSEANGRIYEAAVELVSISPSLVRRHCRAGDDSRTERFQEPDGVDSCA